MDQNTSWPRATVGAATEQRMSIDTPIDYEVIEPSAKVRKRDKLRRMWRDCTYFCFGVAFCAVLTLGAHDVLSTLRGWLLSLK